MSYSVKLFVKFRGYARSAQIILKWKRFLKIVLNGTFPIEYRVLHKESLGCLLMWNCSHCAVLNGLESIT